MKLNRNKNVSILSFLILSIFAMFLLIPVLTMAQDGQGEPGPPPPPVLIESPYSDGNITDLPSFINFVLEKIVLPIGTIIAVFFIVYAGFLFVTAGGSEDKITTAKKTFYATAIGVAILLGSVAISNGIKNTICEIANVPGLNCAPPPGP